MTKDDILRAQEDTKKILLSPNPGLEVARVIGEPFDPKKRFMNLADELFTPDTASKGEDVYGWTADELTDYIITMDSTGEITSVKITPGTPSTIVFADFSTKEYYVTIKDLARGKYDVLARRKAVIGRALDKLETYKVIQAIEAGVPAGNKLTLASGQTRFKWTDFVDLCDLIADYDDGAALLVGKTIAKDIIRWKYDENKNIDFFPEEDYLKVAKGQIGRVGHVRVIVIRGQAFDLDAESKDIMPANVAYLVGSRDRLGIFVRHELEGGLRLTLPSSPVMAVGAKRILSYGVIGYELVGLLLKNPKATAKFTRA